MLNVCQAADSDIHWSAQMVCRTSTRGKCSSQSYCSRSCSLHVTNSIRKSKEWKCRSEKKRGRKCYTGAFASERLSEGCKMLMWLPLLGTQAEHTQHKSQTNQERLWHQLTPAHRAQSATHAPRGNISIFVVYCSWEGSKSSDWSF